MITLWLVIVFFNIVAISFIVWPLVVNHQQKFLSLIVCLSSIIPIVSLVLYFSFGNSGKLSEWLKTAARAETVKQAIAQYGSRQNIIISLRKKLEQLPEDENSAKGWYLLGKLYFNEKSLQEALYAFNRALKLKPNEPDYILQQVSVKFLIARKLDTQDRMQINKLLSHSPNNFNAMNLLAMDAYQNKQFTIAIRYWEQLLAHFPPGSNDSKLLVDMIRQAQISLPKKKFNILVKVNLSNKFIKQLRSNNILYVYAQQAGGTNIPLAVKRITNPKFPTTINLNETDNMMSGRTLADADKIYIKARISNTGNAMPTKGDLFGQSNFFNIKDNYSVNINIEKIID